MRHQGGERGGGRPGLYLEVSILSTLAWYSGPAFSNKMTSSVVLICIAFRKAKTLERPTVIIPCHIGTDGPVLTIHIDNLYITAGFQTICRADNRWNFIDSLSYGY